MNTKLLNVFTVLLSVFVLWACTNGGDKSSSASTSDSIKTKEIDLGADLSSINDAQSRTTYSGGIAYVNLDSIVQNYQLYKDLRGEFEISAKKKDEDFSTRRKRFEKEAAAFQESAEKGLEVRSKLEQMQGELQKKQQDLLTLQQKLNAELSEEEAVMMRKIMHAIQSYIAEYNVTKGYSMILSNVSTSAVVLTADPKLNITTDVLVGLNKAYKTK